MSFGFKRARSIGEGRRGRSASRSLFEKEWDELVIRFDEEQQGYRVRTASQTVEQEDELHTAKLPNENVI